MCYLCKIDNGPYIYMTTSDEQISPASLVCSQNSSHLHYLRISILVMDSFMQNLAALNFKTRLG